MAVGTLCPLPRQTALDSTGVAIASATYTFYLAGTTTLTSIFSDQALSIALANPLTADSSGRFAAIYLTPGQAVKCVLKDSGGSTIWTVDNILPVPASATNVDITGTAGEALTAGQVVYLSDGSGGTAGRWFLADADNAYSSTTPIIGIAVAAIASGASGTIRIGGTVTGLSSLSVGSSYFVSATAGAMATTPPSNTRIVGVADSVTSLVLALNAAPGLDLLQIEVFS